MSTGKRKAKVAKWAQASIDLKAVTTDTFVKAALARYPGK